MMSYNEGNFIELFRFYQLNSFAQLFVSYRSMDSRTGLNDGVRRSLKRAEMLELTDEDFNTGINCLFNQLSC